MMDELHYIFNKIEIMQLNMFEYLHRMRDDILPKITLQLYPQVEDAQSWGEKIQQELRELNLTEDLCS